MTDSKKPDPDGAEEFNPAAEQVAKAEGTSKPVRVSPRRAAASRDAGVPATWMRCPRCRCATSWCFRT